MGTEILVKEYVVRLGDDALILGHRLSEWCRNAPFLEEDLAPVSYTHLTLPTKA